MAYSDAFALRLQRVLTWRPACFICKHSTDLHHDCDLFTRLTSIEDVYETVKDALPSNASHLKLVVLLLRDVDRVARAIHDENIEKLMMPDLPIGESVVLMLKKFYPTFQEPIYREEAPQTTSDETVPVAAPHEECATLSRGSKLTTCNISDGDLDSRLFGSTLTSFHQLILSDERLDVDRRWRQTTSNFKRLKIKFEAASQLGRPPDVLCSC